ncbi:hypothetical protein RI129_004071 [Pyrocoelia pectoralis]|uniref:Peptidase S1 domain-containing protein n=1 Tax=Pyrocoelia pectoralis TaxID=417401 RepID=A0AAN7ZK62_9COLE
MYKLLILIYLNYAAAALESRIINGRDALPGEFGYIVSVQKYFNHICGGSIINEYNVLTAASCFDDNRKIYFIQYGLVKLTAKNVNVIHVRDTLMHEHFEPMNSNKHDIAILKLSSPLTFDSSSVTPISLPTQGEEFKGNTWARISGWGSVDDMDEALSKHLQTATIYILSMEKCKIPYGWSFHKESQMCANNKKPETRRGASTGDVGSPLVKKMRGRIRLIGLFSWSFNLFGTHDSKIYPDVFTKVSHYFVSHLLIFQKNQ